MKMHKNKGHFPSFILNTFKNLQCRKKSGNSQFIKLSFGKSFLHLLFLIFRVDFYGEQYNRKSMTFRSVYKEIDIFFSFVTI